MKQIKSSYELARLLKQLPKEERLRIEGIILGVEMANQQKQQPISQEQKPAL